MRSPILLLAALAAFIVAACSGGATAPTRAASLRVAISPNPLKSAPMGNPIFYDAVWSEVAGVGVTMKSDSARLVDASGNVLPGQVNGCFTGPPCPSGPLYIGANNSFVVSGRAVMVVSAPPVRLDYSAEGVDDNGHTVSVSLQVPVQ